MSKNKENPKEDKEMGIIDHLTEFRKRLIVCFAAVGIFTAGAYLFSNQLLSFLTSPARFTSLTSLTPTEAFMAKMKIAVIFGVLASSPIIFYQIWSFVSPALKKAEKKVIPLLVSVSTLLFLAGVSFAFFVVLPMGLKILAGFSGDEIVNMWSIGAYISFLIKIILVFGLVFELPLVILFLTKIGVVTPKILAEKRKYALILFFVAAAVLTPGPDVFTQVCVAVPLIILYEASIILAKIFVKSKSAA